MARECPDKECWGARVSRECMKDKARTYSDRSGNQVGFVEHKDEMLVRSLFAKILLDAAAPCAEGISGIEYVDDDV